jgi:hypothetical protein
MALSHSQMAEITGPVVSVDEDDFNVDMNPVPSGDESAGGSIVDTGAGGEGRRGRRRSQLTIRISGASGLRNRARDDDDDSGSGGGGGGGGRVNGGGGGGRINGGGITGLPDSAMSRMGSSSARRPGSLRDKRQAAHQIVSGSGDILTRRSRLPIHTGKEAPNGKFSSLVHEYVGNCIEEHCNIGELNRLDEQH